MSICAACVRGRCDQCTGYDGPTTTHPDSLPFCTCSAHRTPLAAIRDELTPPTEHATQSEETA
jgi:hypothetical protein